MQKKVYAPFPPNVEKVGKAVLGAANKVQTALGPGLLEPAYEICTKYELTDSGSSVPTQIGPPVTDPGIKMYASLKPDMIVNDCVIVEVKSVETMHPIFDAKLIKFNIGHMKDGIRRMVV